LGVGFAYLTLRKPPSELREASQGSADSRASDTRSAAGNSSSSSSASPPASTARPTAEPLRPQARPAPDRPFAPPPTALTPAESQRSWAFGEHFAEQLANEPVDLVWAAQMEAR